MTDPYDLERFVAAHEPLFDFTVECEWLGRVEKRSFAPHFCAS